MIQSIYTTLFEKGGKYYLFNSLSCFFCEITQNTYETLLNRDYSHLHDSTIEMLTKNKVLISEDEKYLFYLESKSNFQIGANDSTTLGLVIAPTIRCNFNCPYCFESKSNSKTMSEEVESNIIEFINLHPNIKAINLTWYGGEPLLAFSRIESLWRRISKELPSIKVNNHSIVTNGWLIDDSVVRFCKKTNVNFVQITLDGIREHHNITRCLKDGSPTFDKIFENIIRLAKDIPSLTLAIRVNVNRNNANDYAILSTLFSAYNLKNIYVYPGFIREDTNDNRSLTYNSISGKDCHSFLKLVNDSGVKTNFFPSLCSSKGCLMSSSYAYLIGPAGEIYKCWNDVGHKDRVIGNISGNLQINKLRYYRYLHETSAFSDEECKECSVFPICSGGCGHYRYRNKFENGCFDLCSRFKDKHVLEESLLMSIGQ